MQTIILYGNSLVVSAFGAAIGATTPALDGAGSQECEDMHLVRMDAAAGDALERLAALDPAAIIFDRTVTRPDFAATLLRDPEVLLIGVDPSSDTVLLLSGHEKRPVSPADLLRMISQGQN